jgi:choline-sulfatase
MTKHERSPLALQKIAMLQYDTAIANLDASIGALLGSLDQLGLGAETTVVLTSDHGEYLGEHGLVGHSKDVYEEAIWVPLMVRSPHDDGGHIVNEVVSIADIPRLMAQSIGGRVGAELKRQLPRDRSPHVLTENYYSRSKDVVKPAWGTRFHRIRRAVYDWPYKYIQSSDGAHELYNLELDPLELTNIVADHGGVAARLSKEVAQLPREVVPPESSERISGAELEALRALGYVE